MYTLRRRSLCALCFLLCAALMLPLFLLRAGATAADDQEFELLGELASRYEGGDAGAIVYNSGDIGGKSYGAYQSARSARRWKPPIMTAVPVTATTSMPPGKGWPKRTPTVFWPASATTSTPSITTASLTRSPRTFPVLTSIITASHFAMSFLPAPSSTAPPVPDR